MEIIEDSLEDHVSIILNM